MKKPPLPVRERGPVHGNWCVALPYHAVVARLLGDGYVMRVALTQPGGGDLDEAGLGLHLGDRRRTAVAHRGPEPADERVECGGERTLVRDPTLDPLRHELRQALDILLEVAILAVGARLHRAEGAHAAVLLEALPLVEHDLARTPVHPGEQAPEHDGVGPCRDRLGDIARVLDPAVGDHWYTRRAGDPGHVHNRRDLWHADPRHDAGRAEDRKSTRLNSSHVKISY